MTASEQQRWTLILQALQERGSFTLTRYELPGLAQMVTGAPLVGDPPPALDPQPFFYPKPPRGPRRPTPRIEAPTPCTCRAKILAMLGSATVLHAQLKQMVSEG